MTEIVNRLKYASISLAAAAHPAQFIGGINTYQFGNVIPREGCEDSMRIRWIAVVRTLSECEPEPPRTGSLLLGHVPDIEIVFAEKFHRHHFFEDPDPE